MPEGHSFACEGEAAVDGVSETRSHAVGQSLDKRTLLAGRPGSAGRPLMRRFIWRGYCATHPPIAQLLQVGSHRSLLLHPTCVGCLCRCLSTFHRLIPTASIAGRAGPIRGCYVRRLSAALARFRQNLNPTRTVWRPAIAAAEVVSSE